MNKSITMILLVLQLHFFVAILKLDHGEKFRCTLIETVEP